ncbi:hypothetical protein GEV41_13550 [Pseudomonas putida]|uniref:hypothetical protein n=2 Tax=Pseudomonas TaxID=286 RepID=UPI0015712341|nr:hypothetical protein [Pseudomonas putida]QKL07403.1 hypothetical protein GEV41_13550 [Pseudomonas putida]
MQVIYAGLRNGQRDQAIHDALQSKHVAQVSEEFRLSPNTIRAAAKRIDKITVFDLQLTGWGKPMVIGKVASDCFRKAALGAYRAYRGTFQHLDLPCWAITDGAQRIEVTELRLIDTGKAEI